MGRAFISHGVGCVSLRARVRMGVEGGGWTDRHVHIHGLVVDGNLQTWSTIAVGSVLDAGIQRLQRDDVLDSILVLPKRG